MSYDDSTKITDDDSPLPPHRAWPLVSVIVATWRRPVELARALDSVLAQTFRDMEVFVVHDGPPGQMIDGELVAGDAVDRLTLATFHMYADKFEQAGVDFYASWTDEHTGYYTYPRNQATENSRGVYIANLDDDNEWVPDALASLVTAIDEGEKWDDLVYGRRHYVLDPGAPTTIRAGDVEVELSTIAGDSPFVPWDNEAMVRIAGNRPEFNFIDSSDFIVAKGAMYRLGIATEQMWDESKRRFGDYWLVSNGLLAAGWRFKPLDKVVQIYHVHADNVSLTRPANELPIEMRQ